jgi:prepilin-type N-terminal cleavage/methylation domain-containing protein
MKKKEKGFTLVELVVTLAVLVILLSVSVFGLVAWQEDSRFNQQNEYAQALFVAAQNQLAEYSRNGRLEEIQESITNAGGNYDRVLDVTQITDSKGIAYTQDSVWYESSGKGSEASKYRGELCYVSCVAGDYEQYKAGTLGNAGRERGADVLFELLSSYVYDESILSNSISVEFSPEEGQVFAVCYSDRQAEFVYTASDSELETVSISNREESYRREHMIGYYGVDTLAKATDAGGQQPGLAKVILNNEETLNLSFQVTKVAGAAQQLKYLLNVYDKDAKQLVLSLMLDGSMIHNYESRSAVPGTVTRYVYDADGTQTAQTLGTYDILAWIEKDETVRVVLDAADIQASSAQYQKDLKNSTAGLKSDRAAETVFASTYSFHRFGVDADNIYCTLQGTGENYKSTAMKQSNAEAAYFATAKLDTGKSNVPASMRAYTYDYTLENARHLYNIRFVEDMSAADENKYNVSIDSDSIIHRFQLKDDIDWDAFAASGNLYYTKGGSVDLSSTDSAQILSLKGAGGTDCARLLTKADFPSLGQLRYGDTFYGNDKTVSDLEILETSNVLCQVYGSGVLSDSETARPVGLFVSNYGTISNLNLDKITAEGSNRVGAFCGSNRGNLTNLSVLSSDSDSPSSISGQENVGGIMGYQESLNDAGLHGGTAQSPELSDLTNRAEITGKMYVGGIVGAIHIPEGSTEPAIQIENCENYGAIVACNSDALKDATTVEAKTEPRYLGGIVGYCNNEYTDESGERDPEHLLVLNCTSSPEYTEAELDLFLERGQNDSDDSVEQITDKNYKGTYLKGVYVGGIVGYNNYGTIANCSTEAERGVTGYLFGYQYVGGIVGFNQGPASGIEGGSASGGKGVNEINVVGCQYVGGISGCNADVLYKQGTDTEDLDENQVIQPDSTTNLNVKVSNWENRGIIFAVDSYAGGITGYNAGWLYDCDSKVRNTETSGFFQETYSGDYAGGITGYNNGVIGKSDRAVAADGRSSTIKKKYSGTVTTVCYVMGRNYVGGIVGYNDADAVVEDYGIAGGKIKGEGSFVGGYAGLNASINLLMDDDGNPHSIVSKPNEVSGQYFVGGSIGGNILDCTGDFAKEGAVINAKFETNNFFGKVSSEAFAGGFVGYNLLLTDASDKSELYELQSGILTQFDAIESGKGKYISGYRPATLPEGMALSDVSKDVLRMMERVEVLDNLDGSLNRKVTRAQAVMVIAGEERQKTQNRLGGITGKIYLGGVIGYNDEGSALEICYVTNTTPIQASMAIPNAGEQSNRTREYDGETYFTYSYAGGIIGKVPRNGHLLQCENGAGASVTVQGTYTGGLAEINEGIIEKCEVSSIGAAATDYIGGICGLNKKTGTITECILQDKTVNGRNYVGGIVAENFGTVQDSLIQNKKNASLNDTTVRAFGVKTSAGNQTTEKQGIAGCVAAYNGGTILQSKDLIDVKVVSNGNYVGAVVGVNEGAVTNGGADRKTIITGSVGGQECVGGVIGINKGKASSSALAKNQVSGYRNEAEITAEYGNAGGIVGSNSANSNIVDCENIGTVISRQSGSAGGITAVNTANITDCTDYGQVSSPNGDCGGIAAWNYKGAAIKNCKVMSSGEDLLNFTAKADVGGITAYNYGSIVNPQLKKVAVYNYTTSSASNIGMVAGINYDSGKIKLGKENADVTAVEDCSAKTYTDNSNVGGVVGLNQGVVSAPDWYTSVELPEGEEDLETRAFDMPHVWVGCTVGYMNDAVSVGSLGGVAGKNEGTIENIGVKGSEIQGNLGSSATGIGGIAGVSGRQESDDEEIEVTDYAVKNCTFDGTVSASGTYANPAYLGGIVGLNHAESAIYGCRIGVAESTLISNGDSTKTSCYGYVGGIAGNTYGDVVACDNYHTDGTAVQVIVETNAGQVGGIVGVQQDGVQVTGTKDRRLSTGEEWRVSYYRYLNDNAIGGIVGSSYSSEAFEYVSNYATALYAGSETASTHYNMARAGIVGRLWPTTTESVHFSYCYNYGDVLGKNAVDSSKFNTQGRCGGIIGQLQFAGVTMESCKNYATLQGGHYTGGMIGCVYTPLTDIEIIDCENHGNLYGGSAASGMVACRYNKGTTSSEFVFYNCVNTGLVGSSDNIQNRSGMGVALPNATPDVNITGYYSLCQNYGYGTTGDNFSGIANGITIHTIRNCFDFSGGVFALAKTKSTIQNQSGNYYMDAYSFNSKEMATGNAGAQRLNYDNDTRSLYLGTNPTNVTGLTTLDGGYDVYHRETSTYYKLSAADAEENIRYRTYLEMHEPIVDFIKSTYCVKNLEDYDAQTKNQLDAPDADSILLNYRNNAGYSTLTWDAVEQAYSYEIQYTVNKKDGTKADYTEEMIGLCRLHIDREVLENAESLDVKIRAKDGCDLEDHYSDWTAVTIIPKEILPAPKYHFELLYRTLDGAACDTGRFVAVLDNADDYVRDGEKIATIYITGIGSWTIDPTVGYAAGAQDVKKGQKQTRAYAQPVDEEQYVQSPTAANVTYIAGTDVLTTQYNDVQFNGFYGDTVGNLSYSMTIGNSQFDNSVMVSFYNQEVMAYDETVGATISYEHGAARRDYTGDAELTLSGFPTDLTGRGEITVKNIYWAAQGYSVYYGHSVAEQLTLEQLKSLQDETFFTLKKNANGAISNNVEKTTQSIWDGDKLRDGYIIYKNTDDTYSVYYSALEEGQQKLERAQKTSFHTVGGLTEMVYTRQEENGRVYYRDLNSREIPVQPAPVISETLNQDEDGFYVFKWDESKTAANYQGAVYAIELTGTTVEDNVVSLTTADGITWNAADGYASYRIQPQSNWNYKTLELKVSRHGAVDSTQKTTSFPAESEHSFTIKLALSQIGAPTVSHDTDEQGSSNMDELLYHVIWSGVQTSAETDDLGGYLITVTGESTAAHYYYVLEAGEKEPDTIVQLAAEAEAKGEPVVNVTDTYHTEDSTKLEAVINLEDFRSEEVIAVSVRAIAGRDAVIYKDGPDGAEQGQRLPSRLLAPVVSGLSVTPDAGAGTLLVSAFDESDVVLTYMDSNGDESDRIRIAVAVYDELPEGNDESDTDKIASDWDSGACEVLVAKSAKQQMSGNACEASYELQPSQDKTWSDYAGKWMKVALRKVSESSISSSWTDEDDSGVSTNYRWFRMPDAQIDSVSLREASKPVYRTFHNGYWTTATAGAQSIVATRTLNFDVRNHADGYKIEITGKDQSVHLLEIRRNGDKYTVEYTGANGTADVSQGNSVTAWSGTIEKGDSLELPYGFASFLMQEDDFTTTESSLYAILSLDMDGETFTLSLPDIISYSLDAGTNTEKTDAKYLITGQVTVQALGEEKNEDGEEVPSSYFDSVIDRWSVNDSGETNISVGG